jgi:hypothetical protein
VLWAHARRAGDQDLFAEAINEAMRLENVMRTVNSQRAVPRLPKRSRVTPGKSIPSLVLTGGEPAFDHSHKRPYRAA